MLLLYLSGGNKIRSDSQVFRPELIETPIVGINAALQRAVSVALLQSRPT